MLHIYTVRFDVTENLKKFLVGELNKAYIGGLISRAVHLLPASVNGPLPL